MKIFAMMAALVLALSLYLAWTPELSREALLQSYSRATTSLVKVNEQTVFVQDSGPKDAPSLVLLHGFGASLQTWDAWAFELEKDRRVLRFDVPGFGLSGPAANNDYSDAADVAACWPCLINSACSKWPWAGIPWAGVSLGILQRLTQSA